MMTTEPHVSLLELVTSLSNAADLISPAVVNHHKQVAYIALRLGTELGLSKENIGNLVIAGSLHDIGALSLKERIEALNFELDDPYNHAEKGFYLLNLFKPFSKIAEYVRFHHTIWNGGDGAWVNNQKVPLESHILHLADRVAVSIDSRKEVLGQATDICSLIEQQNGKMFNPDVVDALKSLSGKECFWLDCVSDSIGRILSNLIEFKSFQLSLDGILALANIYSVIVDFRCRFTANHSSGVAVCAEKLAGLSGFSKHDTRMMKVAGYLHDLGKLAVPIEILNKPSSLTKEEYQIIKSHTYYTYRILEPITGFETINSWASFHHEYLNGSGYPFHHGETELSLGSRIMVVADVFTALSEDRPYRAGMDKENCLGIIRQMVNNKALDADVAALLEDNYEDFNLCRLAAQDISQKEYKVLKQSEEGI